MTTFSERQRIAFEQYSCGENVFITGPGGSGKTHLIRHIQQDAKEKDKVVQVCALTGTAAVILECSAKTIHSWGGIGLANGIQQDILERVIKNSSKRRVWRDIEVLIIDEVSMMSASLFELLDMIAKACRKNTRPFGGIQVIFSGDFFQLPPVCTSNVDIKKSQFCFESPLWNEVFDNDAHIQLNTIFRQDDDDYKQVLNEVRIGKMSEKTIEILEDCVDKKVDDADPVKPTMLFPTRNSVDSINKSSLLKLPGDIVNYKYNVCPVEDLDITPYQRIVADTFSEKDKQYEIEFMLKNINFEDELNLKIGSQVMCIANLDLDSVKPICNGSQGVITSFDENDNIPIVRFNNGSIRKIKYHMWRSEKIPTIAIRQIPLILSWAMTIHKSQGSTLDKAEIDAGSGIFENGQTYVALSRVRTLEGLYLKSFHPKKVIVNKKVQEFYLGLKQ